ncbi:MAG: hypothetical protein KAS17_04555, partial [Victivallaceae bacterium]|nr:hypothetical protein [Victivallaceae bacterium]
MDAFSKEERRAWVDYFNKHQGDDGIFHDPALVCVSSGVCCGGGPHMTGHILAAIACLGGVAAKTFALVDQYVDPDTLIAWLEALNWGEYIQGTEEGISYSGNRIMNMVTLFQYARDYQNDGRAGKAMEVYYDWMDSHNNPNEGVWGTMDISQPKSLSHAVHGAFHFWAPYFYDKHPVPHPERAIDTVLVTQNELGSFSQGLHNSVEPLKGSACDDIDSLAPLTYITQQTDYRRDDVREALIKGCDWVLKNWMDDGGFVFMLDREYSYGDPQLKHEKNASGMFPTWFRILSLAVTAQILPDTALGCYPWHFADVKPLL